MTFHQPHEVRHRFGRKINWNKPPKPNAMCSWSKRTTSGKPIKGSFRTLCHLNRLNNLALRKYGVEIQVIQSDWNTGVPASKFTHDYDSVWDLYIPGVSWWEQQRFFRANGFACWYRHPPLFGNHIHGFTLPHHVSSDESKDFRARGFKVGLYVDGGFSTVGYRAGSSQIEDYYNHKSALVGHAHDGSWFPKDIEATVFDLGRYVAARAA